MNTDQSPESEQLALDARNAAIDVSKGQLVRPFSVTSFEAGYVAGYQAGHRRAREWRPIDDSLPLMTQTLILTVNGPGIAFTPEKRHWIPSWAEAHGAIGWLPLPALPEGKHT